MVATTVLTQEPMRGSFTTSSVPVASGSSRVRVVCPMSDANAQDPANACRITTEGSSDGGLSWSAFGTPYDWQGGLSPRDGSFTRPDETTALPDQAPGQVRAVIDTLGNVLDVGVTLEVL